MIGIRDKLDKLPSEIHLDLLDENSTKAHINYHVTEYRGEWMCAYVIIPMKVTDIECHLGVSFCERYPEYVNEIPGRDDIRIPEGYHVLGWDFNHLCDGDMTVTEAFCSVRETLMWLFERGIETL